MIKEFGNEVEQSIHFVAVADRGHLVTGRAFKGPTVSHRVDGYVVLGIAFGAIQRSVLIFEIG